jgi:hypothetical protein
VARMGEINFLFSTHCDVRIALQWFWTGQIVSHWHRNSTPAAEIIFRRDALISFTIHRVCNGYGNGFAKRFVGLVFMKSPFHLFSSTEADFRLELIMSLLTVMFCTNRN